MHRSDLIKKLSIYSPEFEKEIEFRALFLDFIREHENCFERSMETGHITASAWIMNKNRTKALFTHHAKLNKWLQLGGHADGEPDVIKVAFKEAHEESGLSSIELISLSIFDIDIHTIPARKKDPEHLHYDIRFLFEADENEQLTRNHESNRLEWIKLEKLQKYTNSVSILRMAKKCDPVIKK